MKSLIRSLLLTLAALTAAQGSRAQTTVLKPAVAFVKADRSVLYIKKTDSTAKAVLQAIPNYLDSIRNLAVLGQSPDGQTLLLAGSFGYLDITSSLHKVYTGLVSIPSSFDPAQGLLALSKIKFLKSAPYGRAGFLPIGTVANNGSNEWFAIFQSSAEGGGAPLYFYHGHLDQDERQGAQIDSVRIPEAYKMQSGYHMSNMELDPGQTQMMIVAVDQLANESQPNKDFYLMRWDTRSSGTNPLSITSFGNQVAGLDQGSTNTDSLFGLTLHVLDGTYAEIGITNAGVKDNSISLYKVRYLASSLTLNSVNRTIPRSIIPSTMDFFSGRGGATPSAAGQTGTGGDMIFSNLSSSGGDTVLFVTHESPYNITNRGAQSGIYLYNFNGQAELIYNDPAAQELQPMLILAPYAVPPVIHYPGVTLSIAGAFPLTDTGKSATQNVTVTDTSAVPITISSVDFTGPNAMEFSVGGNYQQSIQPQGTTSIPVVFSPVGTAGTRTATMRVHFGTVSDSVVSITLSGSAHVQQGSVAEDPSLALNVTMQPNPFTSSVSVHMTAPEAGKLGIVVHDALGRTVYASELRSVSAGATESFEFNAQSLSLSNGTYYVTALFGDRQISRQVIYLK